jgi:hypothetical protein
MRQITQRNKKKSMLSEAALDFRVMPTVLKLRVSMKQFFCEMKENILVNVSPDADFFNLLTFSYYHK